MHQLRRLLLSLFLQIFTLLICCEAAHAQRISVFDIDSSNYPQMEAKFLIVDEQGNFIRDLGPGDLVVAENGTPVDASFTYECPVNNDTLPMSTVLVCDRSGSMSLVLNGISRLELLKQGVRAFIQTTRFVNQTGVAMVGFDDFPVIISDFDTSANRLLGLVNRLTIGNGTVYTPAFLDPVAGGISLLQRRPQAIRRVLIFITDGRPSIEKPTEVRKIIDAAKAAKVTIYTITLAMTMPDELDSIARETGGVAYSDVNTVDEMRGIYSMIALRSQGLQACVLRWRSDNGCGPASRFRDLSVVYRPKGYISHTPFTTPARSVISLQATPQYMWFGAIVPPDSSTRPLTIKAVGSAMKIDSAIIAPDGPFTIVDWGGSLPPFTLQVGESRTLLLKFKPTDSTLRSVDLQFYGAPCPYPPITLSGGFGGDQMVGDVLRLLSPVGGEGYGECDTIPIRWEGARPSDSILIEMSLDNGVTWSRVTTATGLYYQWRPSASGSQYKVRISKLATKAYDTINTIVGGGTLLTDGAQGMETMAIDPTALALDGSTLYYAETGRSVVRKIDLNTGIVTTVAGTGAAGYSGDGGMATSARLAHPTGLAIFGGVLYICDYSNHRVREVDLATGVINTLAGTGQSGFSGDGGPATSAVLQYPARVAFINNSVYISDAGNHRIRRVDLRTHQISTIAGGGTYEDGDGSPATLVKLTLPLGLATHFDAVSGNIFLYVVEEGKHRVRRIALGSNVITTVAGSGTAGFNGDGRDATTAELNKPNGVAVIGNRIYISDAGNNRVRYVDRTTKLIHTFAGTGRTGNPTDGPALLSDLNAPAGIAGVPSTIYIADSRHQLIREVRIGSGGEADSSRAPFTVTLARLSIGIPGRQLDFGPLATDASRDSMIVTGICNTGNVPLRADSTIIVGPNAADFQIVSGPSSSPIPGGSCNPLEIRFAPSGMGRRSAKAFIFGGCGGVDSIMLSGTGIAPCGQQARDAVDFGAIIAGTRKDSVLQQVICNNGRGQIDGKISIIPADGAFSVIGGDGLFSIDPGECHTVTIRFSPQGSGATSSLLDFGIPTECGAAATILHGRGIAPQQLYTALQVEYPASPCWNGARDTTLELFNLGDAPLLITDAEVIANNEGFSLLPPLPSSAAPLVIPPGGKSTIALRFDPASVGAKSARVRLMSNSAGGMVDVQLAARRDSLGILPEPSLLVFDGKLPAAEFPYDSFAVVRNTGTVPIVVTGGTIGGTDPAKFDIPLTQFPITIEPGASARIAVRAVEPTSGTGYSAALTLAIAPACDTAGLVIDLFEGGALPAISATDPRFRDLLCESETEHDTTIIVRNPGGSALTIDGVELRGDGKDHFIVAPPLPVVIPPGEERAIPVRFRPLSSGTFDAELVLRSDAASGDSIVRLNGRRDLIAIALLQRTLNFGTVPTGEERTGNVIIRNNGNVPATITIPASSGPFSTQTPGMVTLQPGEEYSLGILFETSTTGAHRVTLRIVETRCGIPLDLDLAADVDHAIRTTVSLPVDSAGPGARVRIPIRIAVDDRARFEQKGGGDYTTTIRFSGAVLIPKGAIGATMTDDGYDEESAVQMVTLRGHYLKGDTLALLECVVPATDSLRTPLTFMNFTWSDAAILADTVNGFFTISEECYDIAMVRTRPRVLKIRPTPVGEEGMVEIAIDEPTMLRATLVDPFGREVMTIADSYYAAGSHTLPLHPGAIPSGLYSIVIVTPYGETTAKVLVVR